MSRISFVFPFFNEEEALPILIRNVCRAMENEPEDLELIFVNDDSTDHSIDAIEKAALKEEKADIIIVNLSRRFGCEESFLAGIEHAKGDAVILMYTDLQDPPEVAKEMLRMWRSGAEIVHTIRRKRIGEHPLKIWGAFFAYRLIGKMAGIKIPYDAGEFKLLSKSIVKHLRSLPEVEPYLRGLIPWLGFKQAYVEYDLQPRLVGHSKVPLFGRKAWSVFLNGIISFSDVPVCLVLLTGLFGMSLVFVLGTFLIFVRHIGWFGPKELLGGFFWATQMLAMGLIGLYLLKTYKNIRGRPRYIVKDIINVLTRNPTKL